MDAAPLAALRVIYPARGLLTTSEQQLTASEFYQTGVLSLA